jgi:AcrR family transcriptional regulator
MPAEPTTVEPKGRELWLLAGQELLRRGGISTVKLQALTAELGLTTGSFYHHFSGMADYLDDLARYYGSEQVRQHIDRIADDDPRVRLRRLAAVSRDERMGPLDAAMRAWAAGNELAAEAVHQADELLLRYLEQAFRDLGFDRRDAQLRALLLFSVGVARVQVPWRPAVRSIDDVLTVLAPG